MRVSEFKYNDRFKVFILQMWDEQLNPIHLHYQVEKSHIIRH